MRRCPELLEGLNMLHDEPINRPPSCPIYFAPSMRIPPADGTTKHVKLQSGKLPCLRLM